VQASKEKKRALFPIDPVTASIDLVSRLPRAPLQSPLQEGYIFQTISKFDSDSGIGIENGAAVVVDLHKIQSSEIWEPLV
jgi:hypothetical protein